MKQNFFRSAVLLNIAGSLVFLAAVAYLGTFTRHMSDDYCESYITQAYSPLGAVLNRYEVGSWRAANRYSNLLFVGVMESWLGQPNVGIIPMLFIILWAFGLVILVQQARKLAGIEWQTLTDIFFGTLLAFLSILQAPNPYQIFYWRSSMATHFVPLVFLNFVIAYMFSRSRLKSEQPIPLWLFLLFFIASFMIGGFSEPPVTVMIVGAGLSLISIWLFAKDEMRRTLLALTGTIFAGAISALTVMAVSPAVSNLSSDAPSFIEWIQRTIQYTYFFLVDTVKALPLPILFSIICPAVFIFMIYREKESSAIINPQARRNIALALPIILILLIAAGFSTSAYGQAYPVGRARFFAHYLITITLMFEGALLGIWLSQLKWNFLNSSYFAYLPALILLILAVYPFRAGWRVIQNIPEYRARQQEWDRREAHIYKLRGLGQIDLTVPQLDGVDGVKELDSLPTHWVNLCAAKYYQVNSIRAIPVHGNQALEDYYNYYGN